MFSLFCMLVYDLYHKTGPRYDTLIFLQSCWFMYALLGRVQKISESARKNATFSGWEGRSLRLLRTPERTPLLEQTRNATRTPLSNKSVNASQNVLFFEKSLSVCSPPWKETLERKNFRFRLVLTIDLSGETFHKCNMGWITKHEIKLSKVIFS